MGNPLPDLMRQLAEAYDFAPGEGYTRAGRQEDEPLNRPRDILSMNRLDCGISFSGNQNKTKVPDRADHGVQQKPPSLVINDGGADDAPIERACPDEFFGLFLGKGVAVGIFETGVL